ncbi:MAG: ATP synthase subunit B/B' [Acidimicrobiia bacterium]|nr:ATP synthase subunit B/B' [Acidimicrobiia bacterium]
MTDTAFNNDGSANDDFSYEAPVHHVPEVQELLLSAIEIIESARPMPLSTSLMINGEPLLDLLNDAIARLPEELRAARWLLRERDEYLEGVTREGEEITRIARSRAERMVERTEVVKSAEQRAQRILADAESQARLMRRETEDFCDARLASLEGILDRTRTVVATGRTRLQGTSPIDLTEPVVEVPEQVERVELFDQDFS